MVLASLASVSELYLASALTALDGEPGRFRCIEGLQTAVEAAVSTGRAEAAVGDLTDVLPDLVSRPLWSEPFRVALATTHRRARRRSVTFDQLAAEALIGFSREAELRSTVDRRLADARRLRTPDIVVDRYRTALALVQAGSGVMVVPAIMAAGLPAGVKLVDLEPADLHRTMGVIHRPDRPPSSTLGRLLDHLVAAVAVTPEVEIVTGLRAGRPRARSVGCG